MERVPESTSQLVSDAQLILAERLTMLYGVSADPKRMLEASKASRSTHQRLGLDFNRHELMTNFLFAFTRNRDHASAAVMAELLASEPVPENVVPGLADTYTARFLNEIGNYEQALFAAERAGNALDPAIQRNAHGEAMIALAGLGRRAESLAEMKALGYIDETGALTERADRNEGVLHARALLAANAGDADQAVALQNQRLDLMIGKLYAANAEDTASLLSHLENTRERQAERNAALQREAELQAQKVVQQRRVMVMLAVLLLAAGAALIALWCFWRYRERVNAEISELQVEALSAEKMKTEFLGMINHELRTPLNGVIGLSDALIHHHRDPDVKVKAQAIQDCGQNLFDMLESLLDMSAIESDKFELAPDEAVLLPGLKEEARDWTRLIDAKRLTYTQFFAPELSRAVTADARRVRQCLRIMLSNATKFTHQGRIHLHSTATEIDGRLDVCLIVADTGQGISQAVQDRMFMPFIQADSTMTRKYGGAGLSLAVARKLARMMDGDLTVTSTVDRGSEFRLMVSVPVAVPDADHGADEATEAEADFADKATTPQVETEDELEPDLSEVFATDATDAQVDAVIDLMVEAPEMFGAPEIDPEPITDTPTPGTSRPAPRDGLTVLIVEDLPSNRDVLRLMLEPRGHHCLTAESGAQALDILGQAHVDAVIMDIHMPDMSGIAATRRIRSLPDQIAKVPVVALSADGSPETRAAMREAGANGFLTKPVVANALLAELEALRAEEPRKAVG